MSEIEVKRRTRSYGSEFKQEAVKLALSSTLPISITARELGIPEATLYSWIHKAKTSDKCPIKPDESSANVNTDQLLAENKTLRKRLARLEQEKAILKKAAAYFAKEME